MVYHYENGTTRWRRFNGEGDVRAYRGPKEWTCNADLIEHHPITGKCLGRSEWWIREVKQAS